MLGFKLPLKSLIYAFYFNLDFWESFWGCNDSFRVCKGQLLAVQ